MNPLFFLFGFLPSFAWLFFFLKEDIHPEPKKMIVRVFFAGGVVTFVAIAFELLAQNILGFFNITRNDTLAFFTFAAIEEVLKFFAAYFVIRRSPFFDEPVDAMIYMVIAGLGFAFVENVAVLSNIDEFSYAVGVLTLRFIGATLLHSLSSALVGYYWALQRIRGGMGLLFVRGLFFASLLHLAFNYLIFIQKLHYSIALLVFIAIFILADFEKIKEPSVRFVKGGQNDDDGV